MLILNILNCKNQVLPDFYEAGGLREKENTKHEKVFQGHPRSWVNTYYSNILKIKNSFEFPEELTEQGWYFLGRKETNEEAKKRAMKFMKNLKKQALDNLVSDEYHVYIMHGDFFDLMMGYQLHRKQDATKQQIYYATENTSITCFEQARFNEFHMRYFNNYEHLEDYPELVSDWHAILNNIEYKQIIHDRNERKVSVQEYLHLQKQLSQQSSQSSNQKQYNQIDQIVQRPLSQCSDQSQKKNQNNEQILQNSKQGDNLLDNSNYENSEAQKKIKI